MVIWLTLVLFCCFVHRFFFKLHIVILINWTSKNGRNGPYSPTKYSDTVLCNQTVTVYCEATDPQEFCSPLFCQDNCEATGYRRCIYPDSSGLLWAAVPQMKHSIIVVHWSFLNLSTLELSCMVQERTHFGTWLESLW